MHWSRWLAEWLLVVNCECCPFPATAWTSWRPSAAACSVQNPPACSHKFKEGPPFLNLTTLCTLTSGSHHFHWADEQMVSLALADDRPLAAPFVISVTPLTRLWKCLICLGGWRSGRRWTKLVAICLLYSCFHVSWWADRCDHKGQRECRVHKDWTLIKVLKLAFLFSSFETYSEKRQ